MQPSGKCISSKRKTSQTQLDQQFPRLWFRNGRNGMQANFLSSALLFICPSSFALLSSLICHHLTLPIFPSPLLVQKNLLHGFILPALFFLSLPYIERLSIIPCLSSEPCYTETSLQCLRCTSVCLSSSSHPSNPT